MNYKLKQWCLKVRFQMNELKAIYDGRKSFYKKAMVETVNDYTKVLYSYNTKVAKVDNGCAYVYGFYSQTTLRHIKEFLRQEGFNVNTKADIEKIAIMV